MTRLNVVDLDRTVAILILNGKLFEDANHQYALAQAYRYFDLTDETLVETSDAYVERHLTRLCDETRRMSLENTLGCYSVYDDAYLIGHTRDNMELHASLLQAYAKEHHLTLGYYQNFEDDSVVLMEHDQQSDTPPYV